LRRDAVQPDIEAERKKRDEIEAGKSYCSRRFGGATCDDKSAQIYARFDKNDWRIQPAEFYLYDVYPLDGRHDGGYYTVKDCVTIDVLPRTPGNNVYVGFMVWSNFTATKCRGLVSLN